MFAAVLSGDAKNLAELMRQDPGFNVNMDLGWGASLLHYACDRNSGSPVIALLLSHPDIDVNVKNNAGWTPFYYTCCYGHTSCVRELLKDSRVKVNEPDNLGRAPLWRASFNGRLDIIRWWIASGREIDLGTSGDVDYTDAIGGAKKWANTEVVNLLERFQSNATQTRHVVREELGLLDELAAEMFALVVFVSDGLLQVNDTTTTTPAARFFKIARRLPLELQMVLCRRVMGSCNK